MAKKKAVKRVVKKASAKKTITKKAAKRKYTRKAKPNPVEVDAGTPPGAQAYGEELHERMDQGIQGFAQKLCRDETGDGQFSTGGFLNIYDNPSPVVVARRDVTIATRRMLEALLAAEKETNRTQSETDVLQAEYRLALAQFELAIDNLEAAAAK